MSDSNDTFIVFIATPLAPEGDTPDERALDLARNMEFAKATCRALALVGAATFGPHLYYTQFLDEASSEERALGITLGLMHMRRSDAVLLRLPPWRTNLSRGMLIERDLAVKQEKDTTIVASREGFEQFLTRVADRVRS